MSWSDATVFETNEPEDDTGPVEKLANGNFVIAWEEIYLTDNGKFAIYNTAGTEVVAPKEFHAPATAYIALAILSNGNFFIVYSDDADGDKGKFVIYDSAGDIVKSETQFETGDCSHIACCTFSDNSVFVAYRQANANFYYVIFNSSGTITAGPTQISGVDPNLTKAIILANNNAMVVFYDADDSGKLKVLVRDSSGAQVVATTEISALTNCTDISICLLTSNNIAIAYKASSDAYLQIIQSDTTGVKAETEIEALAYRPKVSAMSTGKIMYVYGDNANTLQYRIFTNDGTEETGKTAIDNPCLSLLDASASGTYNIVVYKEGDFDGAFRIFDNYTFIPPSDMVIVKRLVAAANSKIWYEDV